MFHQKYLHTNIHKMLALLIKAGADPWGLGVSHTPICHFCEKSCNSILEKIIAKLKWDLYLHIVVQTTNIMNKQQ